MAVLAGEDKRDTVDVFVESVQALPGRLEAFLQARRAPAAGSKAARQPLLASKLHADAGDAIRVRSRVPRHAMRLGPSLSVIVAIPAVNHREGR